MHDATKFPIEIAQGPILQQIVLNILLDRSIEEGVVGEGHKIAKKKYWTSWLLIRS